MVEEYRDAADLEVEGFWWESFGMSEGGDTEDTSEGAISVQEHERLEVLSVEIELQNWNFRSQKDRPLRHWFEQHQDLPIHPIHPLVPPESRLLIQEVSCYVNDPDWN